MYDDEDDDSNSSCTAVADDEDNVEDVRNIRCRSNATRRDKSTVRTDNRMALDGCWKVYFVYFFLESLVLAEEDVVIVILFLTVVVAFVTVVVVRDLFAEVVVVVEIEDDPTDAIIFGGATCRIAIAANVM